MERYRFCLATWNLDRPSERHRAQLDTVHEQLHKIGADVWVLVETDDGIDLSATHQPFSSQPVAGYHRPEEHWVTVWSKWPGAQVDTYDGTVAVCVDISAPIGRLLVYGTVLPYHGDKGAGGHAPSWAEQYRVIPLQGADWRRLRAEYPEHLLCVAGDLNQSRDGRRWSGRQWYGTTRARTLLTQQLEAAQLECATNLDFVERGELTSRSTVMHLCLDARLHDRRPPCTAWFSTDGAGRPVSDHNGVHVDLSGQGHG